MKKHLKIFIVLFLITIIIRLIGADDSEFFILGTITIFYGLFISFIISKTSRNKIIKFISILYQFFVGCFIVSFIIFEGFVFSDIINVKNPATAPTANYSIVLGAGLKGTHVGNILEERVNTAIEYLNTHKDSKIIVSGGQGPGEIIPESTAMKNYLIEHGINPNRILEDDKSKTTVQNIEFSKKILEEHHASKEKIVIITSAFNVFRVQIVSKLFGINADVIGVRAPFRLALNYSIREYPATIVDILRIIKSRF